MIQKKETCWQKNGEDCREQPHKWEVDFRNGISCEVCDDQIFDELAIRGNPFLMVEVVINLAKENEELKTKMCSLRSVVEVLSEMVRRMDEKVS